MAVALVTAFSTIILLAISNVVEAGDPDITSDYILPLDATTVDSSYFVYSGLRGVFNYSSFPETLKATKASMAEFPALNGQSVSMTVLQFPSNSINPPHVNSRASGILFVVQGGLEVGLIDENNKLYTQTLILGDVFVFPKGLVHFQYNADTEYPAIGIAGFGSASSGTFSIPNTVFETGVDEGVLAECFKTDITTIQKLKAGLVSKA